MSSAPARILPSLRRALRGAAWAALFAILAAGAAGLIAEASHPPGTAARAELTAEGDSALNARLDQATAGLEAISDDVDRLADAAKYALEVLASPDPSKLRAGLDAGSELAATISAETQTLRASLANLEGGEPDAVLRYSNATLVRRAAVLAALEAAVSLDTNWQQVTAKAVEASKVTTQIAQHDATVLDAAAKGRAKHYSDAVKVLDEAILAVAGVKEQRDKLIADAGPTVLDEWINRNRDYDLALQALYTALVRSGGKPTPQVVTAEAAELKARNRLPPDRRTIIVIVAEVARGGLTQAVVAIEDARGRLDDALAAAGGQAGPSGQPPASEAPDSSEAPSLGPAESGIPLP
jgi:hypothetical protein